MQVEFLDPEAASWPTLLGLVKHDFYHLPSYVAFAARHHDRGQGALAAVQEGGSCLLVPLIIREIPRSLTGGGQPAYDATSPRGYPGPLTVPPVSVSEGAFAVRALDALASALRGRGIVSLYSRLHPLFPVPDAAMQRVGAIVDHGDSVFVDLTLSDEVLHRQTEHGHRQAISKATRRGYAARMDEDWDHFDGFVDVFQQSMDRVGATSFWRLSRAYFVDLRESLGDRLHLCVVELGDEVAAAALITEIGGIVEYHLAGTSNAHLSASPSKLVINFVRSWAKARGNRVLHLTGSLRRGDSLSQFKAGFSPLQSPVRSWRLVADEPAYQDLANRWSAATGTEPDPITGFFPAYRKPATSVG